MIEMTGNRASAGLWLSLAACISLIAAVAVRSRARAAQDANRLAAAAMAGGD